MEITLLIRELERLKSEGILRVFVLDATNKVTLDLIEVRIDDHGDGQLLAD